MARQYLNLADVYGAVDQSRANQMQAENQRMQQQRYQMEMQQAQRAQQEQDAVRGIYRGAIETDETGAPRLNEKRLITDLYGVAPEQALKTQEGFTRRDADAAKLKRETSKAEIENKAATAKYLRDRLASVTDENTYMAALQEAQELGADALIKSAPSTFNPDWVRSQVLTADKFLEQSTPKYEKVDLGGKIQVVDVNPFTNPAIKGSNFAKTATIGEQESQRHNRVAEGISGAQLGLSRDRLAFDRSGGTAAVNAASGVTAKPEKFTEGMRNNAMYAQRMVASEKLLEGNEEQKPTLSEKGLGFSETASNLSRSPARKQALQAQRDWVRAKLRKESGAAIGKDEMENEILTYFPQIGDDADTIEQKRLARVQATDSLVQSAGGAYTPPPERVKPILDRKDAAMPPKEGTISKSKSGRNMVYIKGQWEYR